MSTYLPIILPHASIYLLSFGLVASKVDEMASVSFDHRPRRGGRGIKLNLGPWAYYISVGMTEVKELIKKICLLGDAAVGKTSLIRRYVYSSFDDKYITTIGTKVTKKSLVFKHPTQDMRVRISLLIWDILGQKEYSRLHPVYYQGAEGGLVVSDGTRPATLKNMEEWAEGFQKTVGRVPLVFLINKSDLIDIATFDSSEAEAIARKYNSPLYFTSAKTGDNVERSFLELGNTLTYSFFKKINVL
jgi:small GTP-binding protein